MEDFINKIIELDKSIEDLEENYNTKKREAELSFKNQKVFLKKKYEEFLKIEKKNYADEILKDLEADEKTINESTIRTLSRIKEAYNNQKGILIEDVFTNHFKGSD